MIPILDLKAQYESIKDEINAAIAGVLGGHCPQPVVREDEDTDAHRLAQIKREKRKKSVFVCVNLCPQEKIRAIRGKGC